MKFLISKNNLIQIPDKEKLPKEDVLAVEYIDENAIVNWESVQSQWIIEIYNQDYWEAKYLLQDALFGKYWDFKKIIIAIILLFLILTAGFILGWMWKVNEKQFNQALEQEKIKIESLSPTFLLEEQINQLRMDLENEKSESQTKIMNLELEKSDKINIAEKEVVQLNNELKACYNEKINFESKYSILEKWQTNSENKNIELENEIEKLKKSNQNLQEDFKFEIYVWNRIIKNCKISETQMCKDLYFDFKNEK